MLIILSIISWWFCGGFDCFIESWNDFMYGEINRLIELNNDYIEFLNLKENILNNRNTDIVEYKRQIAELVEINRVLHVNLDNSKLIISELESQLFSEEVEYVFVDDDNSGE